ncbi:MAG: ABC transporter permease subunit [Actinobacteria bacterium]|nr:ABC transporter permease subunit [Actinomycetota bacterium]
MHALHGGFPALRRGLFPLLLIPLLLAVWQVLASVVGETTLASPYMAFVELVDGLSQGWLLGSLLVTMHATTVGFGLAAVSGVWAGSLLGVSRFWREVWEPLLLAVYAIPKVTLFPLFLFFLGFGLMVESAFGFFHGFFPVAIFTMNAVAAMPATYMKVARVTNLNRWQTFRMVMLPATLPHVVNGLRFGFSLTFLGVVLAEMFASPGGSGKLIASAVAINDTARMLALVVPLVVIALLINGGFLWLHGRLSPQRAFRQGATGTLVGGS